MAAVQNLPENGVPEDIKKMNLNENIDPLLLQPQDDTVYDEDESTAINSFLPVNEVQQKEHRKKKKRMHPWNKVLMLENLTKLFAKKFRVRKRVHKDKYTDEVFVNTAKSGFSLDETENFQQELPEVEQSVSEMATNRALVSVIGVKQFNKFFSCTSCSQKLVGQGELMKCDGCKLIQKCDASKITYFARLFIKDEDKSDSKFFVNILHQQIMSIVNKSEDCPDDLTEMQFTELMLQHEPFEVAYNSADSKVTDIY
eukprot:gene8384-9282_t